ncbi:MAG: hypothetical protein AAF927_08525 [Bacteroidota bacterium]
MFGRKKIQYVDPLSRASDPVGINLSTDKLKYFRRTRWAWPFRWLIRLRMPDAAFAAYLKEGDSRAAIILTTEPQLVVAAYTDELDAVALLQFPEELVAKYELVKGQRLLTVNVYEHGGGEESDLTLGPEHTGRYGNFIPLIAEFLSDDIEQIEWRKARIAQSEWQRTWRMGEEALFGGQGIRDGEPYMCSFPGEVREEEEPE